MAENGTLVIFAGVARTATVTSDEINNRGARGLLVVVNSTAITATPIVTPSLQAYDTASSTWVTVWTAAATITTATTTTYMIYPGASGGNFTEVDGVPIPARFRLVFTHTDADSITYSVGAHLLI